jgi:hypothetical protein
MIINVISMIITEIKKGQTGTGLLIENDGYVSLDMPENKILTEAFGIDGPGRIKPKDLPDPFIVSAVFQKFGIENANGRIYPEGILKSAVEKYLTNIRDRRGYGELNHPSESSIDLGRIAMNIIDLEWRGHTLIGKMEIPISDGFRNFGIVSTCADMLAQWLISGLKVGVSSRGLGSVTKQFNKLVVGDDYEIVCWDVVSQPSTPLAFIGMNDDELSPYIESKKTDKPIVNENKFEKFDKWLLKS